MRIGVNLIPLRPGRMGGAETYFRDLLSELLRRGDHEYVLVTADYNHDTLPGDGTRCQRVLFAREPRGAGVLRLAAGALRRLAWPLPRLRRFRRCRTAESLRDVIGREAVDLWFCPFTNLEPRVTPVPAVVTVFDVQHEHYPEFFAARELDHRRAFYPESCMTADHVITISEFTRRCVIERYGVEPERASTVWLAAGADVDWGGGPAEAARVRERYRLPPRYVFYPANTWPHKNHARLVEALALYRRAHGEELGLVLTGTSEQGQRALDASVARLGLCGLVHALGYVPRADLPGLYAGAACLIFPSLFEGFGIPLVEAMLAGCPIVAADATSVPEVLGDAGVLFDPLDPGDIARALAAVVRDPTEAAELARRGRRRAALFSTAMMAERTLAVLERARSEPRRGRGGGDVTIAIDGVYSDRWMGGEGVLALRGPARSIEIEGDLPRGAPVVPQEVVIRGAGREPLVFALSAPGPFSFTVPLAPEAATSGGWELSLRPRRTFRPDRFGASSDGRELSLRVSAIRALTEDGRRVTRTLGSA